MVVAADCMPMASRLDRMDAGFDQAEIAHREVAQTVVPVTASGHCRIRLRNPDDFRMCNAGAVRCGSPQATDPADAKSSRVLVRAE
jgi:hypothetical protein